MKIVQLTTDSREHFKQYGREEPYFGTAPAGLLKGFESIPDVEVHVISCSHVAAPAPDKIAPNIHYHQIVVGDWGWGKSLFLGCAMKVRKLIAQIRPDIVHGQGTERDCAMGAVLSGFPNVLTLHGNMRVHAKRAENAGNKYYKMTAALEGFCLRRTDGVIAISNYTKGLVEKECRKTWLLPNAVDKRFFEVHPVPPAIPRMLVVGSLDERKNPVGLIEACGEMLRTGKCTIAFAGQGNPDSAYYKRFGQLLKDVPGLELLGFVDRDQLASEFSRTSIIVLPTFEDNCPMVVLEGMAAGLPVAASRVGGVPDLIENEKDGMMFDPHQPETMSGVLTRLVGDVGLRKILGEAGRRTAMERFHPNEIARKHLEIYNQVISGGAE